MALVDSFSGGNGFYIRPRSICYADAPTDAPQVDIMFSASYFANPHQSNVAATISAHALYYGLSAPLPAGRREVHFARQNRGTLHGLKNNNTLQYLDFPEVGILPLFAVQLVCAASKVDIYINENGQLHYQAWEAIYRSVERSTSEKLLRNMLLPFRALLAGAGYNYTEKVKVMDFVRLPDYLQAIYVQHRVLLSEVDGTFTTYDLFSIQCVLEAMPPGVKEQVHHLAMWPALTRMLADERKNSLADGTIILTGHETNMPLTGQIRGVAMPRSLKCLQAILIQEIGYLIDANNFDKARYDQLYQANIDDSNAYLNQPVERLHDMADICMNYFADTYALLAFVSANANNALGQKLGMFIDCILLDDGTAPAYQSDDAHNVRRAGSLFLHRAADDASCNAGMILQVGDYVIVSD